MYLVLAIALIAACSGDKLDRTYLPPATAHTAGGSPESLQTPFRSSNQGLGGLPTGGYRNEFDGVVVDAVAPGTRTSDQDVSGLGGPRLSYGSTNSKVGEAAFTADGAFPRVGVHSGQAQQSGSFASSPERPQAARDRASNTLKYESDVSPDRFNYAFETDNGIVAEENGVEVNGVRAQGGYSYTGDDGQVYSVTYTADEGGYQPRGDHLPTPPPIPEEILKSLEQNAKEEAAGIVDDGSYDAQKYNTGEDYTKSDSANEKYNRQQTEFGNRPPTDADSSGTFINKNNQGFVRPTFNQFSSISSQSASQIGSGFDTPNNKFSGNYFGISNGADKNGFDSGSNNEYFSSTSGVDRNRRPTFNNQPQVVPSNQQSTFTQNAGLSPGITAGNNKNSEPSFIPLSQQKLQDDSPKKSQTRPPIFGKPTIIDSSLSIKDPFGNRPSSNRFTQNKQPVQKPHNNGQIGGSFQVVSGNVYSSKNEYLPPQRQFNAPNQNKGQGFQSPSSIIPPRNGPPTDSKTQVYGVVSTSPFATSFASASNPTVGFQSNRNNGQHQYSTQQSQIAGSGLSSLSSNANNRFPLNKDQSQYNSGISSVTRFGSSSQSQYKPSNFVSQSPTLQPQTELTTPLESSNQKGSAPVPIIDGPDSPNFGGASSNLPSFGTQSSNSFGQSTFNTQKLQQVVPTQASASTFSSIRGQSITQGLQNNPSPELTHSAQFPNKQIFDVQYSSSTPRPSFSQNTQQQGVDDSYYYNTPSRPLNIPTARPEVSRFSSSLSDTPFRVTQTSLEAKPQTFDFSQTSFTSQSNKPNQGSTRYPRPPTLEPISPTYPSIPFKEVGNTFSSQFNRVTQASASVFSSPTSASQQSSTQLNQEGPGSSLEQNVIQRLQGVSQSDSPSGSSSQSQMNQYNSEIYEYKKPPQTFSTPQNIATSAQTGQTSQFGASSVQNSESYKPNSNFGSTFTQPTISTGQPQISQGSKGNQAFNLIGQVQGQSQSNSRPGQFDKQISTQTQDSQGSKGNQAFNYNGQGYTQSQSESRPTAFPLKPTQNFQTSGGNQVLNFNTQEHTRPQSESRPEQFGFDQSQNSQSIQGASKFPPVYDKEGPPCCKQAHFGSQSSQSNQQNGASLSGSQIGTNQGSDLIEPATQGSKPVQSVSNFAGIAESFGGPRQPPSFDANGYHY